MFLLYGIRICFLHWNAKHASIQQADFISRQGVTPQGCLRLMYFPVTIVSHKAQACYLKRCITRLPTADTVRQISSGSSSLCMKCTENNNRMQYMDIYIRTINVHIVHSVLCFYIKTRVPKYIHQNSHHTFNQKWQLWFKSPTGKFQD